MTKQSIDFGGWTQEQKERWFQPIAIAALPQYGLEEAAITFLGLSAKAAYRVRTTGNASAMLLSIHSPFIRDPREIKDGKAMIRSGLQWLNALHRDTDLVVQHPIANRWGNYVSTVSIGTPPEDFNCSLVSWVEGDPLDACPSGEQARLLGEAMGKIHNHSSHWSPPAGFQRPRYDWDQHQSFLVRLRSGVAMGVLDAETMDIFERAARRICQTTDQIGEALETWGLIHADLKHGNCVFRNGQVGIIDFDAGGFGHYYFDMATTLATLEPARRRDFLNGYMHVRPLSLGHETTLESFILLCNLRFLGCFIPEAAPGSWIAETAREFATRQFTAYLAGQPFLESM